MSDKLDNAVTRIKKHVDFTVDGELFLMSTDHDCPNNWATAILHGDRLELEIDGQKFTFIEEN